MDWFLSPYSSFSKLFWQFTFLPIHTHFSITLFTSIKKSCWGFIRNCITPLYHFGENQHLYHAESFNPSECRCFFAYLIFSFLISIGSFQHTSLCMYLVIYTSNFLHVFVLTLYSVILLTTKWSFLADSLGFSTQTIIICKQGWSSFFMYDLHAFYSRLYPLWLMKLP